MGGCRFTRPSVRRDDVALATAEIEDELKHDYRPIRDYALIGDCHGAALVSRDGSIDWCCLRRFDADPIFCRILDARIGGYFSIRPVEATSVTRGYLRDSNILESRLTTNSGTVVVTDFMPVGRKQGSGMHNYVDLAAPNWVVRIAEATKGAVELDVQYRPTILFGRERAELRVGANCIAVEGGPFLYHAVTGFSVEGDQAEARVKLDRGQRLLFIVAAKAIDGADLPRLQGRAERYVQATSAFWREWIAYCRYRGPLQEAVRRSLLAIKLLIYAPSGAIVAAPTTSLPESIGGVRNWDYRYCWLRDSAFSLYALAVTGYGGEARRFSAFLPRACAKTAPDLRAAYGIEGESDIAERVLRHLEGYRQSRPVRRGNGAFVQRQLDVYGEILDWAILYEALGGHSQSQVPCHA
jgi:GH15 family glucan-1,4-alpha-glucosidase